MKPVNYLLVFCAIGLAIMLPMAVAVSGQVGEAYNEIEVRLQVPGASPGYIRVRLLSMSGMTTIFEAVSRPDGQVKFVRLREGEYVVQTMETEQLEGTQTNVSLHPADPDHPRPESATIFVEIPLRRPARGASPGVIAADVDLKVPKEARKRFEAGWKASQSGDSAGAIKEYTAAIELYRDFYTANLELARILRSLKRTAEAESAAKRLTEIAPKKLESHLEYGKALLELGKRADSARELREAVAIDKESWSANYYLGWALLEDEPLQAGPFFEKSLALDEQRAVRAHLALARIAEQEGKRDVALKHLDAYVAKGARDNPEVEAAKNLAAQLRRQ